MPSPLAKCAKSRVCRLWVTISVTGIWTGHAGGAVIVIVPSNAPGPRFNGSTAISTVSVSPIEEP